MPASDIAAFFQELSKSDPAPRTELAYKNHFTLLVAVVLSAQATDIGVNRATKGLFKKADNPKKMMALGEAAIRREIKTIGLYRNKAKNVYLLSQKLLDTHGGKVPDNMEALIALPGVGRKTANVVMNEAFGVATFAVDTHVFRLSNRSGLAPGKDVLAVEKKLDKKVPDPYRMHAHHWLILHGRYICLARKPRCGICPVREFCRFKDKAKYED
ncbi:MAG: endonuclease III [Alphaproteobacteria bacterium]|nr:endonuclease III [Alphaproteobacteria bacterium]